jgi:hypothetical protein
MLKRLDDRHLDSIAGLKSQTLPAVADCHSATVVRLVASFPVDAFSELVDRPVVLDMRDVKGPELLLSYL